MKKTLVIIAVAALAFVSCKKNYTCTCKYSGTSQTGEISTTINDTKKGAKEKCSSFDDPDPAIKGVCTID